MPAPYSKDLRIRAIKSYEEGEGSQLTLAKRYKIGLTTFESWWREYKRIGRTTPILEKSGRPSTLTEKGLAWIKKKVLLKPDMTLEELCRAYECIKKRKIAISVMHRGLKKIGFRLKKKSHYALEQERPDIKKSAAYI